MEKELPAEFTRDDAASWDYAEIWDKFPVPARPSKEELRFLEKDIAQIPNEKLLILGSTIEYRSLCKRLGINPYVADFERSHYEILTGYAQEDFSNEYFLETDWLEIEDKNTYDIIVGHRAINVIGKETLGSFFKKMYEALAPGGVFFCKGNVLHTNEKEQFIQTFDYWASKENREYPLFSYIEVELYFHTADENGYVVYPKARGVIKKLYEQGKCSPEDFELIKLLISMSEDARFRGLIHEEELRAAIEEVGFSKSEWIVMDKDICKNMPVIKLTK